MFNFDAIAERRILDSMERGDFADLPGAGSPLELDHDPLVRPDLRMALRVLKNAGMAPAEAIERKEMAVLEALVAQTQDRDQRTRALQKLALLRTRLGARRAQCLVRHQAYAQKVLERLACG